jgi:phenylpropionate dioxygenase-like ring-hydroxylating dioxygenase large terminal subunit
MLSGEDNELLTRVGPDTAMGAVIRHYWIPVLRSCELEPGGRVKRVMLLGERLIAYRALDGTPGLIAEFCPHRGASLYFGRVEEAGMRCVYHGWKFGLDGQCLETPNEPRESAFAAKICQTAYPCAERGGVIWAYMGRESARPPLPDLECTRPPGNDPASFFVRSASVVLPAEADWVRGATPRLVIRQGQQLMLA